MTARTITLPNRRNVRLFTYLSGCLRATTIEVILVTTGRADSRLLRRIYMDNNLERFVPRLCAALRNCIKTTEPLADINAYIVADRKLVSAAESLLAEIAAAEAHGYSDPAAMIRPVSLQVDTGRKEFVGMCFDLLCQSKESACGHWARSRNEILDEGVPGEIVSMEIKPDPEQPPPFPDGDARNEYKLIGCDEIAKAMMAIINDPKLCRADIRSTVLTEFLECDAGNIDDEICDVIIQVALFGEVVFS